jgi:uncharacterized protein YktB (UPF0637 family)
MRTVSVNVRIRFLRIALSAVLFLTLLIVSFATPKSHADSNSTADEFQIKRDFMRRRVNDFYNRLDDLDKQDQAREAAANEKHKERVERAQQDEKARLEFVKQRKQKPAEDPTTWQKELVERAKEREKNRIEFVKRREEYNRESRSFDSIPPDEELGLETPENH